MTELICFKACDIRGVIGRDIDGVSLAFEDWRFNLRRSNTEPLVRLNVETRGTERDVHTLAAELAELIRLRCDEAARERFCGARCGGVGGPWAIR